jgi:OOP family OmpA-OmpF porin
LLSNDTGCCRTNANLKNKGGVNMRRICFAVVCLAVVLSTAVSFAYERRVGLGVSAGACLLTGADDKEDDIGCYEQRATWGPMMSFILRKEITYHWSLGGNVAYGWNSDKDTSAYRTNIVPIDLNLIYTFIPKGRVSPYLSAGAGVVRWSSTYRPKGVTIEKEVDPAFGLAGGVEIFLNETIALDLGAKWRYMLTDDKDMIGRSWTDGEGIASGCTSNDNQLWYISAGLTWYPGKCKDSDGDGVCDNKDRCPDTPDCCIVDEFGCPKDSDGDGVCDGCDKCPDTPKCAVVDAKGCPKDSDGDGVWDGCDKCPGTRDCCVVDENGCPKDEDGDGVCDGCDKCPGTPQGVEVDEDGCAKCDLSPLEGITFQFDKSDVVPSPNPILDLAVELIKKCGLGHKIEVQGHTCSIGSDEYNMKLGMKRAEMAKTYLVGRGISADILFTKSYGESKPRYPNDTRENRAKNRRIEFHVIE